MEKKICIVCGKEYETGNKNFWWQLTCSKTCSSKNDTMRATQKRRELHRDVYLDCRYCGENFLARTSFQVYCSKTCRNADSLRRAVESGRKRLYDKTWHYKYQDRENAKQKEREYRRNFGGNRQKTMERDGFKCQKCSGNENLLVHHKDINPKNNSIENLQTLCRGCHARVHNVISPERKCTIEGCNARHMARGMCKKHYGTYYKKHLRELREKK